MELLKPTPLGNYLILRGLNSKKVNLSCLRFRTYPLEITIRGVLFKIWNTLPKPLKSWRCLPFFLSGAIPVQPRYQNMENFDSAIKITPR
jgi:hypothetical protein